MSTFYHFILSDLAGVILNIYIVKMIAPNKPLSNQIKTM